MKTNLKFLYRVVLQKYFPGQCGVCQWTKTVISLVRRFVEFYCNDNMECFPETSLFQACPWNGKIMSSLPESFANRQTKFLYWIRILQTNSFSNLFQWNVETFITNLKSILFERLFRSFIV